MAILVPSFYILAGAIASAMLYSLVTPATRRDEPTLHAFAATCLFAALAAWFNARMLQASSAEQFLRALKSNLDCLILTALAFSVFVTRYAGRSGRGWQTVFAAYASICLTLLALNEARPYGLQYAHFDGVTRLRLPWHEIIAQGSGRGGPWPYVALVALEGVVPYGLFLLFRSYRRTRDRSTLWMLASLTVLVPFVVQGALVRLSLIDGFTAGPFGILIVVAVTGATLTLETKRKLLESEERFRDSERKLRNLFELSPLGIVLTVNGRYLEFNQAFEHMTGYSAKELRTMDHWALTARSYESQERGQLDVLLRTGRFGPYEKEYRRKDGTLIPVRLNGILIGDGARRIVWSIVEDMSADRRAQERIRHLAYFDQLTLLPNRELLRERLQQALSASARSGRYGALLLLNLDNFKSVNDTLGHAAGDTLLQQVATKLTGEVRAGDTLARVNGDEFGVLLEDLAAQPLAAATQAKSFGLKMMQALSGSYALPEGTTHVGCSVGATILAGERQTADDLTKQANIALHQAKKAGRNALRFFDPRMQESVNARATLEGELRNAIAAAQFTLHYQLQVDENGRQLGAEALLRWQHPERGLVLPGEFIPLAEETHMILPIGQWVIDAACARLAAWSRQARTRELSLAVNVSSLQFQQPDFAMQVLGAIRRHGIDARRLKLELTETMLQGDLERTVSTMNLLKAEGVQFALDDFGTGYSSLQYLKQLPLDQLKIDRSFVHDIDADPNDKAIVTTIVAIAGHLGLDVIAEGVETLEQLEVLLECGCTRYQGYLYGRPMPPEQLFEAEYALTPC
ncbi:MAG: EAL domain-containing protein [Gammaproteobacteria bacterium]|nr:EAL domain-containing protein [Gammaproteobacteria bacterium]